jgi:hypothetical protein
LHTFARFLTGCLGLDPAPLASNLAHHLTTKSTGSFHSSNLQNSDQHTRARARCHHNYLPVGEQGSGILRGQLLAVIFLPHPV